VRLPMRAQKPSGTSSKCEPYPHTSSRPSGCASSPWATQ
jgi:hypothetical protein